MASITDLSMRQARNNITSRSGEMHGLVTSYDPKNHLGKVTYQPEGERVRMAPYPDRPHRQNIRNPFWIAAW